MGSSSFLASLATDQSSPSAPTSGGTPVFQTATPFVPWSAYLETINPFGNFGAAEQSTINANVQAYDSAMAQSLSELPSSVRGAAASAAWKQSSAGAGPGIIPAYNQANNLNNSGMPNLGLPNLPWGLILAVAAAVAVIIISR